MNVLDYLTKDLWLARFARDQMGIPNQDRIAWLEKRLAQLQAEHSKQLQDERATLHRFEEQHQITRVHESLFKPLGMDEYPGEGEHHHDIIEEGKKVGEL